MSENNISRNYTAHYHTFGCKLNFAETSAVADAFAAKGVCQAECGQMPDIIVVNTCSVTGESDRKCRSAIRSYHRRYPDAAILVTGCYAQLKPEEVKSLPGVAIVAGINDKLALVEKALSYFDEKYTQEDICDAKDLRAFMPSCSRGDRTRYFLKVQDGCNYWCTYCTIPKARGRSRSGTIAEIVEQARGVVSKGGKEIVITGVNIGDFGYGRDDCFLDLCRALDEVDGIERYRISSIEPNLLTDEIIDFVASSKRFMPHFHIPLQCGSNEILRLMRRRYDTELFAHKVNKIREVIPDAFIGVDLIVGARGETRELFEESKVFVQGLDISHLHVFPYSERPGTKALEIDYAVDAAEKNRRAAEMMAVSAEKHVAFARRFLGSVRPVLLEHSHKPGMLSGFTDNYLRIEVPASDNADNTIRKLRLDTLLDDGETIAAIPAND